MKAPVESRHAGALSISMMLQLYPFAMLATSSGVAETASLQFGQAEAELASTSARTAAPNICRQCKLPIKNLWQKKLTWSLSRF